MTGAGGFPKLIEQEVVGEPLANVAGVDAVEPLEPDEMMMDLPEEVGQAEEEGEGGSGPEPGRFELAAGGSEEESGEDAENEEAEGVAGHEAEADGGADREPPARVLGAEEAGGRIGGEDPPEVVERRVGHETAAEQGESADGEGGGGGELGPALTTHFAGGEAGEEEREPLGEGCKEAESAERVAEEDELYAGEERREGWVDDVAPGEVMGVIERERARRGGIRTGR